MLFILSKICMYLSSFSSFQAVYLSYVYQVNLLIAIILETVLIVNV